MPTVAEPIERVVVPILSRGTTVLADHMLAAIRLDLQERGVRATPSNVMAYATDTGLPDDIAADLCRMLEAEHDVRHAA